MVVTEKMGVTGVDGTNSNSSADSAVNKKSKNSLSIDDFYTLMAAQLQNQDITNPTNQSDFMNQMIMMSVVQAIETFTDTTTTSYAASLVGKDVTVATTGADGKTQKLYGTITATGLYSGEQIVFINDKSYKLSQIMSIGKLPETKPDSSKSSSDSSSTPSGSSTSSDPSSTPSTTPASGDPSITSSDSSTSGDPSSSGGSSSESGGTNKA